MIDWWHAKWSMPMSLTKFYCFKHLLSFMSSSYMKNQTELDYVQPKRECWASFSMIWKKKASLEISFVEETHLISTQKHCRVDAKQKFSSDLSKWQRIFEFDLLKTFSHCSPISKNSDKFNHAELSSLPRIWTAFSFMI